MEIPRGTASQIRPPGPDGPAMGQVPGHPAGVQPSCESPRLRPFARRRCPNNGRFAPMAAIALSGFPDPKSGSSCRAWNVEQNLQSDVDFRQARSSSQ